MTEWLGPILLAVCAVLIVLPSRYDPAVRWKERNEKRKRDDRHD